MKQKKNKLLLLLEIIMYIGFVPLIIGIFNLRVNIGKILFGIGLLLTMPYIVLHDLKNYENITSVERVRFIGIIIFLPLLVFLVIYLQFFK